MQTHRVSMGMLVALLLGVHAPVRAADSSGGKKALVVAAGAGAVAGAATTATFLWLNRRRAHNKNNDLEARVAYLEARNEVLSEVPAAVQGYATKDELNAVQAELFQLGHELLYGIGSGSQELAVVGSGSGSASASDGRGTAPWHSGLLALQREQREIVDCVSLFGGKLNAGLGKLDAAVRDLQEGVKGLEGQVATLDFISRDEANLLVAAVIASLQAGQDGGDGSASFSGDGSFSDHEASTSRSRSRSRSRSASPVATTADAGDAGGSGSEGFDGFSSPVDVVSGGNGSGDDGDASASDGGTTVPELDLAAAQGSAGDPSDHLSGDDTGSGSDSGDEETEIAG